MPNIFFNSTINCKNKNLLERLGDECFVPFRYLFNGLKITIVQKKTSEVKEEYPHGCWIKTTAAIIILIPALLLGTSLKGLSTISSSVRENRQIATDYFEKGNNAFLDPSVVSSVVNPFVTNLFCEGKESLIHPLKLREIQLLDAAKELSPLEAMNPSIASSENIKEFAHDNLDFILAISHLSKSKTFNPEKLDNFLCSEYMQDFKMQNTLIEVSKAFQANISSNTKKIIQTSRKKNSYGFTLDRNKVYIRFEVIGTGANKKVRRALGLHSLREYAHQTIKAKDSNSAWVETQSTINALEKLQKCRHIIPKHKFMTAVDGKKQRKYVLITKIFKGDGNLLLSYPLKVRAKALQDAAEGLSDIHNLDLIYADFKLDNMLIDENQHGFLSDFGTLSTPKKSLGSSRAYQSPESLKESSPYIFGPKSDSWSLGICTLMLAAPGLFAIDPETKNPFPWISCMKPFFRYQQTDLDKLFIDARININHCCSKDQRDKAHRLLDISQELLMLNYDQRMSCLDAAQLLAKL